MSRKQLAALFVCKTVVLTVGNGLIPLLPVRATQLGATPAVTGYYMAFSYLALTAGTLAAGWLSDRLQRRKLLLIAGGVAMVPALWLMGRATNIWQLAALTATVWFCGGVELAAIATLAGLFAEESKRGRVFGILAMTAALGMLIGGSATGPIVDRWGFTTMFLAMSVFAIVSPVIGSLVEDKAVTPIVRSEEAVGPQAARSGLGPSYLLLLMGSLAVWTAGFGSGLGLSLHMDDLGFSAAAISSTGAISGLVSLPLLPAVGWLSDRSGRKRFLVLAYLAAAGSLLILARSASLWHFWVAIGLQSMGLLVGSSLGQALVADLVPPESLGKGMSLFASSEAIGGIIGSAAAGYAVEVLGVVNTFLAEALLSLLGVSLIIPVRPRAPNEILETSPQGADPADPR